MCGIAGGQDLSDEQLGRMLLSLHHRGPDHHATFQSQGVALGITRLAILDLAGGQQPFHSPDRQITTICNGEIYNWRALRAELQAAGYSFSTECDAEILPAAWLKWGDGLPEKLNGMFALAVHDARDGSLFLARDRCGQKPLYLTTSGPFRFASEVKALAAAGVELAPAKKHLATWLSLRYLPEPATLFEQIETLPAAHWMRIEASGARVQHRYWAPPSEGNQTNDEKTNLAELDELARSSVELALQSDVPIAAYLSAGVDSSLLVHYAKSLGAEFTTTSLSFASSSDEGPEATAFAHALGLRHEATTLAPAAFQELPRVIRQMDRPIGDALILAFDHLAAHTRALGCQVALGGEGPDEYFAGYSFQKAILTAQRVGPWGQKGIASALRALPQFALNQLSGFPAELGPQGQRKAADYFYHYAQKTRFQKATDLHSLFSPREIAALISDELAPQQEALPQFGEPLASDDFQDALALQYQHWLPDWSLIRQDKNTMAHSLEYRSPFLDHRLIDFASALPTSDKIRGNSDKYLWRQLAAKHLPPSVTHRPKQPFYLPLEHPAWRETFLDFARSVLTERRVSKQGWLNFSAIEPLFHATHFLPLKQLAALVILQIWLEQYTSSS